ncbi:hypothetical protein P154DRAFT_527867 [Amniculicola lignicola CBS 123094]|uniref:Uncharacterized protein n=1 Tax=Amniculicola lignicola CBS 123094 TaxID=1392246 RepID=A0A6A5VX73_9PLEO|nr:hypothetical protein P154DRAFT_527867 [Amniculicola lignicola CBS 123094]
MLEPQLSSSRKRQRSEPPQPNETSHPISKKQRLSYPSESQPPAAFWDNLSKIWLTKRALRELDRRNTQAASNPPDSPYRQARRPVTQNFLTELKRSRQTTQYTADYLRCCEPKILKNIKLFARHGGPDLSDLRNFPEPTHSPDRTMSSSLSSSQSRKRGSATTLSTKPTTNTTRTKSTGVYDRDFQQHIIDYDVYPHGYRHPDGSAPAKPNNHGEVNQIFAQPRPSLSPSVFNDEEFEKFVQADADASKEKQVSESVIPIIEGKIRDTKCRSGGIPFTNLDPLTDSKLKFKPCNPDVYYGARPEQLSRKVREELGGRIIPSTQHDLPIAPNFFLAAKGPDGSLAVAGRQACYDGALGARAMHSLQSYGQEEPVYDKASTITSIYHGGTLKMYTSHVAQPKNPGGRPQYHMTQLRSFALTDTRDTCVAGLQAYRNGREWAEEQRNEAIRQANERANPVEAAAPAGDAGASPALSFVTAVSETEAYTMSQESRTSLNEDYNTLEDSEESDSSEELQDYTLPAKRSNSSKHQQTQRKRRNTDVTTEQSERWSWTNGKFQCHKGQDLVKEQSDTPADVWIYFDQGWPDQGGKKWRRWMSATREILYS